MSKEEQLREAAQEFIDRCDRGEIRSTRTYNKFKTILGTSIGPRTFTGEEIFKFISDFIHSCQCRSSSLEYGTVTFCVNEENWPVLQEKLLEMWQTVSRPVSSPRFTKVHYEGVEISIYKTEGYSKSTITYFPKDSETVFIETL